MTFVLGLTGGIASGKSTASQFFQSKGFKVIDADIISRQVVEPETLGLRKIVECFGDQMLLGNGKLDRKRLGSLVFSDKEKLEQLNNILEAEIKQEIIHQIEDSKSQKDSMVVVDIPLLFEADYVKLMDKTMVVYVPEAIQLMRLMKRDGLTEEEAKQRINNQLSIEKKKVMADYLIDNTGSIRETYAQLENWLVQQKNNINPFA